MGEAKRRGTFEDRKAKAVVRRQEEAVREAEESRLRAIQRRERASERQRLLNTQERKEAVLIGGGARLSGLDLAAILVAAAGAIIVAEPAERRDDLSSNDIPESSRP